MGFELIAPWSWRATVADVTACVTVLPDRFRVCGRLTRCASSGTRAETCSRAWATAFGTALDAAVLANGIHAVSVLQEQVVAGTVAFEEHDTPFGDIPVLRTFR